MKFRLEIRDRSFNTVAILDNEYLDLNWSYSRIGGCGNFSFTLPIKVFEERAISGDYNVRIYYRNPSTQSYDLWYQGIIENKQPTVRGNSETIEISGHGYQSHLSRVYVSNGTVSKTYVNQEVSVIVKDILDNYVTPYTNISYSASDIEATTFTPSLIEFNDDAESAMTKLGDLVGGREWGVDKNRNFFFKARSAVVGLRYIKGNNITDYSENQDFKEIINRVIIQGAQSGGTYFTATYNDVNSQTKYGLRTKVVQNSSIVSTDVGSQFATAIFSEFNDAIRKINFSLVGKEAQLEATNPVPLVNILIKQDKYGERKYGEGLYSALVNFIINRINYNITQANSLRIGVDLGKERPNLAEQLSQIEYQIDQQRSAAL